MLDPLVDYIRENIKKYPESSLKLTLVKEGYSSQEIEKAFGQAKKPKLEKESLGFFIAVMTALIFGVVALIRPIIGLTIWLINKQIIVYGLVLASGLFYGWLCSAVIQKTTKRAGLRVFSGIMIAAIPSEIIMITLFLLNYYMSIVDYLKQVGVGNIPEIPAAVIIHFANITPAEILVISLIFFTSFNIPFLVSAAKEQKKSFLAIYLIAPAVFLGMWHLIRFALNMLTGALQG